MKISAYFNVNGIKVSPLPKSNDKPPIDPIGLSPEFLNMIEEMETTKKRCLNDLLNFGVSCFKSEIIDGEPIIKYVDPISYEFSVAIYNAEHTDSQIKKII